MSIIALATMDPCAPQLANQRFLIRHDGAHGVTRPTKPVVIRPAAAAPAIAA